MGIPENEFEMRLNEIIYDLSTMDRANSDVRVIFDKIAEVHHELFDVTVRILLEKDDGKSLFYKRMIVEMLAKPIVEGINARLKNPELFYAQESDDIMNTI